LSPFIKDIFSVDNATTLLTEPIYYHAFPELHEYHGNQTKIALIAL
jgi:hypothetical protein